MHKNVILFVLPFINITQIVNHINNELNDQITL